MGQNLFQLLEKPLEGVPRGYSLASPSLTRLMNVIAAIPEQALLWPWYRRIAIDRPIFIIGAFRSGTTILEKIIAEHPKVGHFWFLTNVCSRFPVTGRWIARLAQTLGLLGRESIPFIHNPRIAFTLFSPYECELVWSHSKKNMWDKGCSDINMGADFSDPRFERYLFGLIQRHLLVQGAARFMNKNPVNCLRLGYLCKLFPDARFVYIVRHPLDTIVSHLRAARRVEQVIYSDPRARRIFEDELRMLMLTVRLKTHTWAQTLALDEAHPLLGIANQWKDLQTAVLESMAHEPGLADQVLLLHYEELVSEPRPVLEKVWDFIGLRDKHAETITRVYAPRLTPPPPAELSVEEREILPRVEELISPVATRLGY